MGTIKTDKNFDLDFTNVVVQGEIRANEIVNWQREYYSGEVTSLVIMDFTGADISTFSLGDVDQMIHGLLNKDHVRPVGKTALVVSEDVDFGLGRMFSTKADIEFVTIRFEVFKTMEEARLWLGL